MKAVILAAGKGTRLGSVTETIPKPMIEVNGMPILQYNIELCKKYGIEHIYINLYHLPEVITGCFGNGEKYGVKIEYSYEDELLGTSGAVRKIAEEFWNLNNESSTPPKLRVSKSPDLAVSISQRLKVTKSLNPVSSISEAIEPFLVLYGDNLSDYNLDTILQFHKNKSGIGTIALCYLDDVSQSGIAVMGNNDKINRFIEKPNKEEMVSHYVNAGIYILSPEIFDYIPDGFSDFGKDIFPKIIYDGKILYGCLMKESMIAIDTPQLYIKNKSN